MDKYFLTLRKSLEVMKTLEDAGFEEGAEKISNSEEDEEFMVLINKTLKHFSYIDHRFLMEFLKKQNVEITELKKIEQWEQN